MQLNMGLGRSSVIVPIVAATLADRSKLARVVVLKSLSEQMFQLLVKKTRWTDWSTHLPTTDFEILGPIFGIGKLDSKNV